MRWWPTALFSSFKPKYYAKIPLGGDKYRYFYSREAYEAWKNESKAKPETAETTKKQSLTDKVKDWLGVDEKQAAEAKKKEHQLNTSEKNRTGTLFLKTAQAGNLSTSQGRAEYKYAQKQYKESVDKWQKSGEEYAKAQEAYLKTPIAKLDEVKNKISNATKFVENVLKNVFEDKPAKITDG